MAEECKCKLSSKENFMQAFVGASVLMSFPALLYFTYVITKRASKHVKKFKLVTPKNITFRVYASGVSGGQVCSVALWSLGIPTMLQYAIKGIDQVGFECHEYIEISVVVPSSRHFQADLSLRQHCTHSFPGVVVTSTPPTRDGHSTLEYADHQPMEPHGIKYKPVMLVEKIMIWIFQGQLNELPGSHKLIEKQGGTKRKQTLVPKSVRQHSVAKPNAVQSKPKRSRPTTRTLNKRPAKRQTSVAPKRKSNNAKLFD